MRNAWKWTLCTLAAAALLVTFSSAKAEDPATEKGKVAGVVLKDGKGISGIQVRLMKPQQGQRPPRAPGQQAAEPGDAPPPPEAGPGGPGGPGGQRGNRPPPVATATTDAEGKFVMNDVPVGEYVVAAGSRDAGAGRARVSVEAGKTAEVKIELQDRPQGGPGGPGGGGQRPPRPPQD